MTVRLLSSCEGSSAWIRAVACDVNIYLWVARGGRWGCSVGGGGGASHTETDGSEMQARVKYWWLVLTCVATHAYAARLLAVLPTNTRSHYVMYGRLVEALARKHHQLTVISHFPMVRITKMIKSESNQIKTIKNNNNSISLQFRRIQILISFWNIIRLYKILSWVKSVCSRNLYDDSRLLNISCSQW